ncbi:glycosyltransferase family 2 protein [Pyramidobacter porci]
MSNPTISLIVLSYNNSQYIRGMLDSIIDQDYREIELVVSDDGSEDFSPQAIEAYVARRAPARFVKTRVNRNPANLGIVKNVETALKLCSGKYVMTLAADDELYGDNTISRLVSEFEKFDDGVGVLVSQSVMCEEDLRVTDKLFTASRFAEIINSGDLRLLFSELSLQCFIAAPSVVFRRSSLGAIGTLADKYAMIEDWPAYLRLARAGVRFKYRDILSIKHREGGISHGNSNNTFSAYKKYRRDFITLYENEIIPYLNLLPQEKAAEAMRNYHAHKLHYKYVRYENILYVLGIRKVILPPLRWILHFVARFSTRTKQP